MGRFCDVQEFVRQTARIDNHAELNNLLNSITRDLGFDYFAIVHHVDLKVTGPKVLRLYSYPTIWADEIIERRYFIEDPIHAASQKTAAGFKWSDVSRIIDLTERHREILTAAAQAGMGEGFTVPTHVPGEYAGSFSFAGRYGRKFPDAALPAAHYVGAMAFEAARQLAQRQATATSISSAKPSLTQRELDCVVLAAQGKSNWDISRLLGISEETVHKHIESAKRQYGVGTRMQLVIRALFDSKLHFGDIILRQ